jgi:hypothetical protein
MSISDFLCSCGFERATAQRRFWKSPAGKALGLAAGGLALAGLGALLYGTLVETRRFRLETVDVTTGGEEGKAHRDGNGHSRARERKFRILHLSDLHLHGDDDAKSDFLRRITDDDYDIVVLTGDIFEKYEGIKHVQSLLMRKPRIGAFAVLGNHDYYDYRMFNKTAGRINKKWRQGKLRDVAPMITALEEVGFTVLQNGACAVPEHDLFVVGIDWPTIARQQLMDLVAGVPEHYFNLCLFHLPKNLMNISDAGAHLAVGGHTHGGQVRIPGLGAIITESELPRHEASGLLWRGRTAFHVSRGLGADPRTNIRFFCPPAATVLNVTHYQTAKQPR